MRLVLHIARTAFLRLTKTPSVPLLWLIIPLALSSVFYFAFGGVVGSRKPTSGKQEPPPLPRAVLLVIDEDGTPLSGLLRQSLEHEPLDKFFSTTSVADTQEVHVLFEDRVGAAALVIPNGFEQDVLAGNTAVLPFLRNPIMTFGPQMIAASLKAFTDIANRFLDDLRPSLETLAAERGAAAAAGDRDASQNGSTQGDRTEPGEITFDDLGAAFVDRSPEMIARLESLSQLGQIDIVLKRPVQPTDDEETAGLSFGAILAGLMLFGLLFVGDGYERRFLQERHTVLVRALTSPLRPVQVLLAQGLVVVAAVLLSAAALLVAGVLLFRMAIPSPLSVFLVLFGFGIFITGFFKTIYARAKTERVAASVSTVAILVMAMTGGGFVPVDVLPEAMRQIVTQTPFGAASQALIHVLVGNETFGEILPFVARVWAWGVGFCVLGFTLAGRTRAAT